MRSPRSTGATAVTMMRAGPLFSSGTSCLPTARVMRSLSGPSSLMPSPAGCPLLIVYSVVCLPFWSKTILSALRLRARRAERDFDRRAGANELFRLVDLDRRAARASGDDVGAAGGERRMQDESEEVSHRADCFRKSPLDEVQPCARGVAARLTLLLQRLLTLKVPVGPVPVSSRGQDTWFSATGPGFESPYRYQLSNLRLLSDL